MPSHWLPISEGMLVSSSVPTFAAGGVLEAGLLTSAGFHTFVGHKSKRLLDREGSSSLLHHHPMSFDCFSCTFVSSPSLLASHSDFASPSLPNNGGEGR